MVWKSVTVPPAMGLPFMSRTRRTIWEGASVTATLWAVPETGSTQAYSGRAPRALKLTHCWVPLRQAEALACWPGVRGPTERALAAMPEELVTTAAVMVCFRPAPHCHATDWPAAGEPFLRARAWVVHMAEVPAAMEREGLRAESTAGAPPVKWAWRLAPLVRLAVTTERVVSTAVTFMVAEPSPVAMTEQVVLPQARAAVPLVTV